MQAYQTQNLQRSLATVHRRHCSKYIRANSADKILFNCITLIAGNCGLGEGRRCIPRYLELRRSLEMTARSTMLSSTASTCGSGATTVDMRQTLKLENASCCLKWPFYTAGVLVEGRADHPIDRIQKVKRTSKQASEQNRR